MKKLIFTKKQIKGLSLIMTALTMLHLFTLTGLTHWISSRPHADLIVKLNKQQDIIEESQAVLLEDSLPNRNSDIHKQDALIKEEPVPRIFNPNKADKATLSKLGLPANVVQNILKYRNAGGYFKECKDLLKIYGLEEEWLNNRLEYCQCQSNKSTINKPDNDLSEPVNINTASIEALQSIWGIGPVLSARISKYRDRIGGFHSITQLKEVYGIEDSTFQKFKDMLIAEGDLRKLDINTASFTELSRHFYIDYNSARAIVNYRDQHGPFPEVASLENIIALNDSVYLKIRPYLTIGKLDSIK